MSNRDNNEFDDFENDFFGDSNDDDDAGFDFDEGPASASVGDDLDDDMPLIEEAEEERGGNRTFLFVALALILVLVVGLVAVLLIATRPTGPSEIDLTTTAIVEYNATQLAFGALTSTQSAEEAAMTQTAAAWTDTPTPTLTATPTVLRPTITPTPTVNETIIAETLSAILAQTQAALPTDAPTSDAPTAPSVENAQQEINVGEAFATQLAFATAQGAFDQGLYATQVALATQFAGSGLDPAAEAALAAGLNATQSALDSQLAAVQEAIEVVDRALQTAAVQDPFIATQLSALVPIGQATQTALAGQSNLATQVSIATRQAIGTEIANATATAAASPQTSVEGRLRAILASPFNAKVMFSSMRVQVPTVEPTFAAYQTQAAQATLSGQASQNQLGTLAAAGGNVSTPGALATQVAIESWFRFATREAGFTQTALAVQAAQGTDVAMNAQVATQSGEQTQAALAAIVSQATAAASGGVPTATPDGGVQDSIATLISAATQQALATQPQFATQAALATQAVLGTRQALIDRLQGTVVVSTPTVDPLAAVNQTATAIAGAFLTATAQAAATLAGSPTPTLAAVVPGATQAFPTLVPTALPQTGLFDDIAAGGREGVGMLALLVIGLIGVIVVSRRVRMNLKRAGDHVESTGE